MACLSSEQTTESLWSFNSLTDAFISPLVYVTNSSLQLELKYFFFTIIKCWIYGIFGQLFLHSTICTENDRCLTDHTSGDAEQGSES